ncbi:MAG: APA family basic amino acid/polyamine antiporter [Halobacteriales archaeon]|jgi:APA family basic amino acid/polyamine antiporter
MATSEGTDDGELERELGLLDCLLLSIGGMIGSAIFVFPGPTGRLVGSTAILAWLGAGLLMLGIALPYAELSLAFPEAGGPAVFPYEALGPNPTVRAFASYLEGISYSLGWIFGITVSALALAEYAAIVVPGAGKYTVPIAVAGIALAFLVNLFGVTVTSRANLLLSAGLLTVLLVFVTLGIARADPTHYRDLGSVKLGPFAAAVQIAITSYGAWTVIPSVAEEVEAPGRTIPRAIVLSLVFVTVLYTIVVTALHGAIPAPDFVAESAVVAAPIGTAAETFDITVFQRYLLPGAAMVAIFTTMLVGTMSAGRVLLALGRQGVLPRPFASIHPRFQVPWVGLLAVAVVSAALAAFPRYFYELLVVAAIVGTGLPYGINILSFLGLRYYRTDLEPAYRAPGGPALAVVAFLALAVAMVGLGSTEVVWSLVALGLLSVYFPLWFLLLKLFPTAFREPSLRD